MIEQAAREATELLSLPDYKLDDERFFTKLQESIPILGRDWNFYFSNVMMCSKKGLKYTFVICTPADADYKQKVFQEWQKQRNNEPCNASLVNAHMTSLLPAERHTTVLCNFLQDAISDLLWQGDYQFRLMGPIVVTKKLDFGIPFYEENSRHGTKPTPEEWLSQVLGARYNNWVFSRN